MKIIHCDIKPENILLVNNNEDWDMKLIDFGLAKKVNESKISILGTLGFMAPELFKKGGNFNDKIDIFSIGVIFYFL